MKVGDIVMIYEDPITERKPEGKAKLIKLLKDDVEMEYWLVQMFQEEHRRWIKKKRNEQK